MTPDHGTPFPDLNPVRMRLLASTYRIVIALAGLLMAANVARAFDSGWKPLYSLYLGAYGLALVVHARLDRLPRPVSVGFLLVTLTVAALAGFWIWGIAGNTVPVLLAACVVAATLAGMRVALAVMLASAAAMSAIAWHAHATARSFAFDPAQYVATPTAWAAAILTFAAMGGLIATLLALMRDDLSERILATRRGALDLAARIEERRASEEALRLSRIRFKLAFDAAPDALLLADAASGRVLEANPAFERLSGATATGLRDREVTRLDVWRDPALFAALWTDRGAAADQAMAANGANGEERRVLVSLRRLERDTEPVVLVVARDVTRETRTEGELRRLRAVLEHRVDERSRLLNAMRRDLEGFVSATSQGLRAPLRAIADAEATLRAGTAQAPPELERLREAITGTERLVDALQELSGIGRRELHVQDLDISALAAETAARLQGDAPRPGVSIEIEPGLAARGDAGLVRLVLHSLLSNAWKFTSHVEAPRISVARAAGADAIAFCVRDNGAGFDMAYAAKLFEPFERLHAPSEFEGAGIGLAIAARAVRRHDGRIWAESSPGRGATVYFTLSSAGAAPPALLLRDGAR